MWLMGWAFQSPGWHSGALIRQPFSVAVGAAERSIHPASNHCKALAAGASPSVPPGSTFRLQRLKSLEDIQDRWIAMSKLQTLTYHKILLQDKICLKQKKQVLILSCVVLLVSWQAMASAEKFTHHAMGCFGKTINLLHGSHFAKKFPLDKGAIKLKLMMVFFPFCAAEPLQRANRHKSSIWILNKNRNVISFIGNTPVWNQLHQAKAAGDNRVCDYHLNHLTGLSGWWVMPSYVCQPPVPLLA